MLSVPMVVRRAEGTVRWMEEEERRVQEGVDGVNVVRRILKLITGKG